MSQYRKNPKGGTSNDFVPTLNILEIERGDPFVTLKIYPKNVISGIYIRFALNPVWVALLLKGTP